MKKLLLTALSVIFAIPAFAQLGLGVKAGIGGNHPQSIYDFHYTYGGSVSTHDYFGGLEAFYEKPLNFDFLGDPREYDEHKIGIKIGFEKYGKNTYTIGINKATEKTIALPVTAYYKYAPETTNFSFTAGAGVSFIRSDVNLNNDNEYKWKGAPHFILGTEYRLSRHIALGFDLRYLTCAKIKKYNLVYSDRSGFNEAITARYYF